MNGRLVEKKNGKMYDTVICKIFLDIICYFQKKVEL